MSDATSRPHIRIRPAGADGLGRWGELWEFRDVLVMLAVRRETVLPAIRAI
jgi:hypothetical protein